MIARYYGFSFGDSYGFPTVLFVVVVAALVIFAAALATAVVVVCRYRRR